MPRMKPAKISRVMTKATRELHQYYETRETVKSRKRVLSRVPAAATVSLVVVLLRLRRAKA
jgi:hypothetical protein